MARAKRRGGRANAGSHSQEGHSQDHADAASAGSPAPTENGAHPNRSSNQDDDGNDKEDDRCPACPQNDNGEEKEKDSEAEPESWVRCDACRTWFHWRCAGKGELDVIDKWCADIVLLSVKVWLLKFGRC